MVVTVVVAIARVVCIGVLSRAVRVQSGRCAAVGVCVFGVHAMIGNLQATSRSSPMTALRIGEAARRTGVSTANIRYYEKEGLLQPPARAHNDYRYYAEHDLHRLRFIRMCRSMDMSLDEVRSLLALDGHSPADCATARLTVEAHLGHVRQRLAELQHLEATLQALKQQCDGQQAPCHLIAALHDQADRLRPAMPEATPKRHV